LDIHQCVENVLALLGVQMEGHTKKIFRTNFFEKFSEISFAAIHPRISHMNLLDFAAGVKHFYIIPVQLLVLFFLESPRDPKKINKEQPPKHFI
jgi:hypothetical protein